MLDNQDTTIILTIEQQQAIEETKVRLLNLENEISLGNKALKQLKSESERAIKDKAYQEELLDEIVAKVSSARSQLAEIEPQVIEKTAQLNHLLDFIREETVSHETKNKELTEREEEIKEMEKITYKRETDILNVRDDLNTEMKTHKEKVARLKEVLATL